MFRRVLSIVTLGVLSWLIINPYQATLATPLDSTKIAKILKFGSDAAAKMTPVDNYKGDGHPDYTCTNFVGSALIDAGALDCSHFLGYNKGVGPDYQWGDKIVEYSAGKATPDWKLVKEGDVIQLRNVQFSFTIGNKTIKVPFKEHHNAIVEKLIGPGKFQVLEQNISDFANKDRKFVTRDTFDFSDLGIVDAKKDGGVWVYRPVD